MRTTRDFSVIIATYSGVESIDGLFDSLLAQDPITQKYEVIVVVDGPNPKLRLKVKEAEERFKTTGLDFRVINHKVNKGRFEARLAGALAAKYKFLLVVDDRVVLPKDYFMKMTGSTQSAIMPDVVEKSSPNYISLTLNKLRGLVYGGKWGQDFEPFYINKHNFDNSPKGTTSLWVDKQAFIEACRKVGRRGQMTKNISDDTKILRNIIDSGLDIYKTSKIRIIYQPRSSSVEELNHIFHRAPKFIDYYFRIGTRYFWPLLIFYLLIIPFIVVAAVFPVVLLGVLILTIFISIKLAGGGGNLIPVLLGLWSIGIVFCAGLVVGLLRKLARI